MSLPMPKPNMILFFNDDPYCVYDDFELVPDVSSETFQCFASDETFRAQDPLTGITLYAEKDSTLFSQALRNRSPEEMQAEVSLIVLQNANPASLGAALRNKINHARCNPQSWADFLSVLANLALDHSWVIPNLIVPRCPEVSNVLVDL